MRIGLRILVVAWVAAACGGTAAPDAAPTTTPTAEAVSASTPTTTAEPTPTAPAVESTSVTLGDRSVSYGGVIFTPTTAELSNEDPTSRENGLGLPSTGSFLHLGVAVENPMVAATLTLDDRRFFSLRIGDTTTPAPLLSDDISPRSAVGPGAAGTMRVSWEVPPDFTLEDGVLVLGTPDETQATLPLAGPVLVAGPTLRAVPVSLDASVDGAVVCGPSRLDASLTRVTQSVDLPADVNDTGGLPRRAPAGQAFVEVTVAFTVAEVAGTDDCTGTIVSTDLITLRVDGAPPDGRWIDGPGEGAGAVGDTIVLTVGTAAGRGSDVTVTIGRPGGDTAGVTFTAS